jgi:16S rRNA (cytosine1402-N4)-methyltransferase
LRTSDDLNAVLESFYGPRITVQDRARIYQALRIAVNDELAVLERALEALRERLQPAGVFRGAVVPLAGRQAGEGCVPGMEPHVCLPAGAAGLPVPGRPLGETLTRKPVMAGLRK